MRSGCGSAAACPTAQRYCRSARCSTARVASPDLVQKQNNIRIEEFERHVEAVVAELFLDGWTHRPRKARGKQIHLQPGAVSGPESSHVVRVAGSLHFAGNLARVRIVGVVLLMMLVIWRS